jgi:hypothetical protein
MLPKFFAIWLIVLIIVPFTAPFSICDLAGAEGQHAPFAPMTSVRVTSDTAASNVPCVSTAERLKFLSLSGLPSAQAKISSPPARVLWSSASAGCAREPAALATILRL